MAEPEVNRRILKPGDRVFSQGDAGLEMFHVERGRVHIWAGDAAAPNVLAEIQGGGIFGEMALIDGKPRSAHATAIEETSLRAIPVDKLKEKLAKVDPFLKAVLLILVKNVRDKQAAALPARH